MAYRMDLDIGPTGSEGSWSGVEGVPSELAGMLRWRKKMAEDLHKMKLKEMAARLKAMRQDTKQRGARGTWEAQRADKLAAEERNQQLRRDRDVRGAPQRAAADRLARSQDYIKPFQGPDMYMGGGSRGDMAKSIAAMGGPEKAFEGMMQSGRILGQLGSTAIDKAPRIERAQEKGGGGWGLGGRAFSQLQQLFKGAGSSRKTGGGIPETGYYKLHEGEHVIPAPETMQDMMIDSMSGRKAKKNKPGEYQRGTDPEIYGDVYGDYTPPEFALEEEEPREKRLFPREGEEQITMEELLDKLMGKANRALGVSPEAPPIEEGDFPDVSMPTEEEMEGGFAGESEMPDIGMYHGEELGAPSYDVEMMPISERTETSAFGGTANRPETEQTEVAKYTMRGAPEPEMDPEDEIEERFAQEQKQIDDMRSAASQELRAANEYARYARERPNSPAADNLMGMAAQKQDVWKKMNAEAKQLQEDKDGRMETAGQQLAQVKTAQLMAQGQVGRGQAQAQGQMAGARERSQQSQMEMIQKLSIALANIMADQGSDPEQAAQMLQSLLTSMLTGQAMGGGFAGE